MLKMRVWSITAFLSIVPSLKGLAFAGSSAPSAVIDAGVVVGTTTSLPAASTAVNQFLGVPFGAPPKRFSVPQKPQPWSQPLNVTQPKPACIQQFSYPEASRNLIMSIFNNPAPQESEDCLYLNIFAPESPAADNGRAVLFWIYGGGLQFGYAGLPAYDGSHFAAYEDVIVVTTNYRTNVFGFPNSPEIPLQDRNLGFLDQRFALDWVQRNIHAFGGDPSKVTIFGESAGAFSVDALLTSFPKNSTPPFHAAILESGQISYRGNPLPGEPYSGGTIAWDNLAAALNCSDQQSNLTCVSAAPASTIKDIIEHQASAFVPVYDNKTLVSNPARARTSGNIARIPILSGTNADEGRVLDLGRDNLTAYLSSTLGPNADPSLVAAITAAYSVGSSEYPTAYDAISQIETDISFQCGAALVANDTAAIGIPSWRYYFNATFPNTQVVPGVNLGAYHSSEIQLVFSTYPSENVTTQEYALSDYMRSAWAQFAKDPEAGPGWNAIGTGSQFLDGGDVGVLGANGSAGVEVVKQSALDGRCALWRSVLTGNA